MAPTMYWLYFMFAVLTSVTITKTDTVVQSNTDQSLALCPMTGVNGIMFDVELLDTEMPQISGHAVIQSNRIDVLLGSIKYNNEFYKPKFTEHLIFDCLGAWYANSENNETSDYVYVTLFDRLYVEKGHSKQRCAMYERNEYSAKVRLAISADLDCINLKEWLVNTPFLDAKKIPQWTNGFMMLNFSPIATPGPKSLPRWITESVQALEDYNKHFQNGIRKLMKLKNFPWNYDGPKGIYA